MIDKTKLMDPAALDDRTSAEKKIIADAQNAGRGLESSDPTTGDPHLEDRRDTGGVIEQTINSEAVAKFGKPGGESDISGGIPNLDETTDAPVEQNEYNR